jgi:membrane-associated phospholipid phosphatase
MESAKPEVRTQRCNDITNLLSDTGMDFLAEGTIWNGANARGIRRILIVAGVLLFHLLCYSLVNIYNDNRPASDFWDFNTLVDGWIPYIGWTWVFYYLGVLYFTAWGIYLAAKLPDKSPRSLFQAYLFMIFAANTLQVTFPSRSPWPQEPVPFQRFMHSYVSYDPYVCLPSMHVALSVMPAALSLSVLRSNWLRTISISLAVLITISTLTLKEHFFLDTLTGLALGLLAYGYYRWQLRRSQDV